MELNKLLKIYSGLGCSKIYVKRLSANDNSKNQVYLGGSFDVLNILPVKEIVSDNEGDWKRTRFKTQLDYFWVNKEGTLSHAPHSQLILYPKYPEVRFSGFLKGVNDAPSDLMANRVEGRLLFLGVDNNGRVIGHVVSPDSELAAEFLSINNLAEVGVFKELTLENGRIEVNSKEKLLSELKRIHQLGWIDAKRFDKNRNILPCSSSNCGGYTLEAELGITPNGYSEPDYLGWEVKQFSVKDFAKYDSAVVTLMTPEPTHGYYVDAGVEKFIRKYGYKDKLGREARINFGGIYKYNKIADITGLKLIVEGFEASSRKITDAGGFIGLIDKNDNIASSWSFASLLKHWNTKHANASYIPSMNRKDENLYPFSCQQYCYGSNIILGSGTDFSLLLSEVVAGHVYYDPGIKLELAMEGKRKQNIKRRSQFRVRSANLINLYRCQEVKDIG